MLPDRPGTYALILRLGHLALIGIGRLGRFQFPPGWYVYVGSAHGPGGLAARVSRHLRWPKPLRWHVDYLRAAAQPVEAWFAVGSERWECAWAEELAGLPGAAIPVPGFGASDCHCPAHLIYFVEPPDLAAFIRRVGGPVECSGLPNLIGAPERVECSGALNLFGAGGDANG